MPLSVGVVLDKLNISADRVYTYLVPDGMPAPRAGQRVSVPFGRGNKPREGMVITDSAEWVENAKPILKLVDEEPLLPETALKTAAFVKERGFCTWYAALSAMLPVAARIKLKPAYRAADSSLAESEAEKRVFLLLEKKTALDERALLSALGEGAQALLERLVKKGALIKDYVAKKGGADAYVLSARLKVSAEEAGEYLEGKGKLGDKHAAVIEALISEGELPLPELCYLAGVSRSVPDTLQKRGIIELFEAETFRSPYSGKSSGQSPESLILSGEQEEVFAGLAELYGKKGPKAALLHGVTGSGKTVVYTRLIDHALSQDDNVILMVPEIALTPQITDRFCERYGSLVAVQHSGMSMGERYDEWKRIKKGAARIVIGTRSAVFAPFETAGLIIIDEEQEATYKSESAPRYHARDVAKYRINESGGMLLLVSATPSIESYAAAKAGKYTLFELGERYGEGELPRVAITDLNQDAPRGGTYSIGNTLAAEIETNLSRGEQTILFLNRRGYNTLVSCGACGQAVSCKNCSISMTYHAANNLLMCHYCGAVRELPKVCPSCGQAGVRYLGAGTQRIDEEIQKRFPRARTVRMDMDTTSYKMSHEKILSKFAAGEYDILIGTQMVTKGLNLPGVTLVGVLLADAMLFGEDFRAAERTFAMLTQVCGRSGRVSDKGRAVIQTYSPENRTIRLAAAQDYKAFYKEEILYRRIMRFPPFCDLYQIIVSGEAEQAVRGAADRFCAELAESFKSSGVKNLTLYPALPSAVYKVGGRYRRRILIKCRDDAAMRRLLLERSAGFFKEERGVSVAIDLNPQAIL